MALTESPTNRTVPEETVSQPEVPRLRGEVLGGGDSPSTEMEPSRKASLPATNALEHYDFHHGSLFSAGELRRLRARHEEFTRALAARLSVYLRLEVEMQMSRLDAIPFEKFVESLPNPTHLTLLKLEPLQGICLLDIPPRLGLRIVDRELGGPGICTEDARDLSQMETRLLSRVLDIIIGEWCNAWRDMMDLRPVILGHENTGRFLQTSSPGSMMLVLGIEARIGESAEQLHFAFPYQTLEPMMTKLNSGIESGERPASSKPKTVAKWNHALDEVQMQVAARLPELQLTARRLAQLKPGDLLPLPLSTTNQVRVCLGNEPKFVADLGTCNNHWALKIVKLSGPGTSKPQ
jgi:flagellar motor switch protein FliM